MVGIPRQIQQLGKCKRSRLIASCSVFVVTMIVVAMMMIMIGRGEDTLSFGEDYIIFNTTSRSSL